MTKYETDNERKCNKVGSYLLLVLTVLNMIIVIANSVVFLINALNE